MGRTLRMKPALTESSVGPDRVLPSRSLHLRQGYGGQVGEGWHLGRAEALAKAGVRAFRVQGWSAHKARPYRKNLQQRRPDVQSSRSRQIPQLNQRADNPPT